jgi:hypothetical protein
VGQGKVKHPRIGKCKNQHFTLHKLIVLPTRILENKFIAYEHDYDYLALSFNQRDFALLKEADLKSYSTSILTVCPINVPLYDAKVPACKVELFFQMLGEKKCLQEETASPSQHPYYASTWRHVVLPLPRTAAVHYTLSKWIWMDNIQQGSNRYRCHPQCYSMHHCGERGSNAARATWDLPATSGHPHAVLTGLILHVVEP